MLFLMNETEFAGFADDSTPYFPCDNVDDVIKILKNDSIRLFKWFPYKQTKANKHKCCLTVSNNEHVSIKIGDIEVKGSDCEKLLGIKIDSKVNFKNHLDGVIKKA